MTVSARHYARLGAVQFLYAWKFQEQSLSDTEDQVLIDSDVLLHGDMKYLQKLLNAIPPRIPEIDSILSGVIHRKLELIDPVELSILRLGVYELLAEPDIPKKVIANECIELSKEFGNPGGYKFINGTLDKLAFRDSYTAQSDSVNSSDSSNHNEFELISKYFSKNCDEFENVIEGIGDDCAIVGIPTGKQLAVSTDTLLENVHFPVGTAPEDIGYKSLAVSLSDLAAMGAQPEFATLSLSIPKADDRWLGQFSAGFFEMAVQYKVALIGGDTVRGPLGITVTVFGSVDEGAGILRSGAKPGDGIYVTGTLGDAALALMLAGNSLETSENDACYLKQRLNRPSPRIDAARRLRSQVTSAIDISDGLIADLTHILEKSSVGAEIELERVPLSNAYRQVLSVVGWDHALSHGDDYELCLTIPEESESGLTGRMKHEGIEITRIGRVTEQSGLVIRDSSREHYHPGQSGYSHF